MQNAKNLAKQEEIDDLKIGKQHQVSYAKQTEADLVRIAKDIQSHEWTSISELFSQVEEAKQVMEDIKRHWSRAEEIKDKIEKLQGERLEVK